MVKNIENKLYKFKKAIQLIQNDDELKTIRYMDK